MPHDRARYLAPLIKKGLSFSPIVGILGHRQVGKTTLSQSLGEQYYTLDLRTTLESIQSDPLGFLETQKKHPTILDECQLLPDLFPALKEQVRRKKMPGQFLLTGSVRFTSRKAIRESLTGRIVTFELLPMDINESEGRPLSDSLIRLKSAKGLKTADAAKTKKKMSLYLERGGLPGAFAIRDSVTLAQRFETQLETILTRDLQLIIETNLRYSILRGLMLQIALNQGKPLDLSQLARSSSISRVTLRRLIPALEGLFLIRTIPCEGDYKRPILFMEDQGEATHLLGTRRDPLFDLERFLYANLRTQLAYRPNLRGELFQYRTRGGALVPLCFRLPDATVGIIPIMEKRPSAKALASGQSFMKNYPNSRIIFASAENHHEDISPREMIVSAHQLITFVSSPGRSP